MKFKEVLSRLTGISTPVFGVSWEAPKSEVGIAREVLSFLADRRVLYNPSELEVPEHCVASVIEIRQFLTSRLGQLPDDSSLLEAAKALRAACRKFLDTVQAVDRGEPWMNFRNGYGAWVFTTALGELRGVFGIHIAQISARYGLDVEDQLAVILPAPEDSGEENEGEDRSRQARGRKRPAR